MNILFVCTYNQIRSRTAETIYREYPGIRVRSAGISSGSGHKVTDSDISWSDRIVVMEQRHKDFIQDYFPHLQLPPIEVLDYTTTLPYMHPQLIIELKEQIDPILDYYALLSDKNAGKYPCINQ